MLLQVRIHTDILTRSRRDLPRHVSCYDIGFPCQPLISLWRGSCGSFPGGYENNILNFATSLHLRKCGRIASMLAPCHSLLGEADILFFCQTDCGPQATWGLCPTETCIHCAHSQVSWCSSHSIFIHRNLSTIFSLCYCVFNQRASQIFGWWHSIIRSNGVMPRSVAKGYIDSNESLQTALETVYKRLHVFQELDPIFVGPS